MQGQFYVFKNEDQAKRWFSQMLEAGFNKPKAVKYGDYKPPKTNLQLAYAHSLINFIALHHDKPEEEVKIDAKREWGIIDVRTSVITGQRTARLKSFADYTKEELAAFVSQVQAYCDENSIYYIPPKKNN